MSKYSLEFYPDSSGKWRWRATSSNGRIVGASSQGFASVNRQQKVDTFS